MSDEPHSVLLKLQFGHDCRNLGCNLQGCKLCQNNPNRRCQTHFREKYVDNANRVFSARCSAPIMVRLTDFMTGEEYVETAMDGPGKLEGAKLQLCLLEGLAYEQKEKDRGGLENMVEEDFEDLLMLDNSTSAKSEPLLVPGKNCPGVHSVDHKLVVDFIEDKGHIEAPILVRTSRSSQHAQGGRTRPFRMMARAIYADGLPVPFVLSDVSEPFVVTTRRTQGAEKALVPTWNDSVSKLPGVGKETFNKLKDLRSAGLAYPLHDYRIATVGQLFQLLEQAEERLLVELGRTLGLKADKIHELQRNAGTVAREDSRKRVWGSPDYPADRLLYPCEEGAPELLREHIEVMRDSDDGVEILSTEDLDPNSLQRVVEMRQVAFESWWAPEHPGWGIYDEAPPDDVPDLADDAVHVASLRQQMDRQCKQRRFKEPSASDHTTSQTYSPQMPLQASGGVKLEAESQPSNASGCEYEAASVQAPDSIFAGPRSVFDVDAYPESGNQQDPLDQGFEAHRDPGGTNPDAQDINNVPSLGQLHEQPIGLAWITSGPYFERSEPFRFKRSVSGNRYRPMTTLDQSLPSWNTAVNQIANNTDAYTAPSAPQPAPGASLKPAVFSGLPPRPSRELRSQTSLDRVANWQQTRPSVAAMGDRYSFSEHFSAGFLQNLCEELGAGNDELDELGFSTS